jgi:hypothetical protein
MCTQLFTNRLTLLSVLLLSASSAVVRPSIAEAEEEQALIVTIRLGSAMSSDDEHRRIAAREDELSAAIQKSGVGEFDGDEFGENVCTIYSYGESAERLFAVALPILKKFRPPTGSYAIKRHGKPGSKQDRVDIGT